MKSKSKKIAVFMATIVCILTSGSVYAIKPTSDDKKSTQLLAKEVLKLPVIKEINSVKKPALLVLNEKKEIFIPKISKSKKYKSDVKTYLAEKMFKHIYEPEPISVEDFKKSKAPSSKDTKNEKNFIQDKDVVKKNDDMFSDNVLLDLLDHVSPFRVITEDLEEQQSFIQSKDYESVLNPTVECKNPLYYNHNPVTNIFALKNFKGYIKDFYIYNDSPYELHPTSFAELNNIIFRNDVDNVIYTCGSFSKMFLLCFLSSSFDKNPINFVEHGSTFKIELYSRKRDKRGVRTVTFFPGDREFYNEMKENFGYLNLAEF